MTPGELLAATAGLFCRTTVVGDAALPVPAHVDPTVNLHPALHAVAADGRSEPWPVDGRR